MVDFVAQVARFEAYGYRISALVVVDSVGLQMDMKIAKLLAQFHSNYYAELESLLADSMEC